MQCEKNNQQKGKHHMLTTYYIELIDEKGRVYARQAFNQQPSHGDAIALSAQHENATAMCAYICELPTNAIIERVAL